MDISDINKVASRKRMNTDAEKLREKVSRETAKIIKLKVAQDTAYWDLKEKLQQLETNHERLQQNMVEVQMQYEAVSGQFQEELRMRPDTLNKLSGTREICEVLEEYGERLRRSVARCRADQQALGAAYGACGARARLLAAEAARARAQLTEQRSSARLAAQRHDAQAQLLLRADDQLAEARGRVAALLARCSELGDALQRAHDDSTKREEDASSLRADVARLSLALDERAQQLHALRAERRLEVEAAQAQRAALELEVAEARRAGAEAEAELQRRTDDLEEARGNAERLRAELDELLRRRDELERVVDDREQVVRALRTEASGAAERAAALEQDKRELSERLDAAERDAAAAAARERHLADLLRATEDQLAELRTQREEEARALDEARAREAESARELEAREGAVARLMADLKGEAQARYRADAALEAARAALDAQRDAHAAALRDKDDELQRQMRVLLDVRDEKARLQERIGGMQATLDNVRKELTGPAPPAPAPAERDRPDDLLYSFLSDGSVDGDVLPAGEVRRRFTALSRGEGGAGGAGEGPLSLSQLKKDFKMKKRTFFKSKRHSTDLHKIHE